MDILLPAQNKALCRSFPWSLPLGLRHLPSFRALSLALWFTITRSGHTLQWSGVWALEPDCWASNPGRFSYAKRPWAKGQCPLSVRIINNADVMVAIIPFLCSTQNIYSVKLLLNASCVAGTLRHFLSTSWVIIFMTRGMENIQSHHPC